MEITTQNQGKSDGKSGSLNKTGNRKESRLKKHRKHSIIKIHPEMGPEPIFPILIFSLILPRIFFSSIFPIDIDTQFFYNVKF